MNGRDGNAGLLREYDLAKQADRDVFLKGSNAGYGSTAGFAVVASKYENKAAFLDLQPLFARVREAYFTTEANYQKTRDAGPGPNQWPPTFEGDPAWKPPVVTVVDVPQPTAVLASLYGGDGGGKADNARAFIASLDGKVGVYSVGGLATDAPASPREVVRLGEVQVGRNPTCLTYQKYSHDTILACSRGDREIAWVKYAPQGAQVTKPTARRPADRPGGRRGRRHPRHRDVAAHRRGLQGPAGRQLPLLAASCSPRRAAPSSTWGRRARTSSSAAA